MDSIGQVVTFLLLLCCTEQGNAQDYRSRTRSTTTTLSYEQDTELKKAKKLYFEYYPNYGYEPYWYDGEWVLSTPVPVHTTRVYKICGEECNTFYKSIKQVCAAYATNDDQHYYHCGASWWNYTAAWGCKGRYGINYDGLYTTFDTYCKFLNAQCKRTYHKYGRWMLIHIGACRPFNAVQNDYGYFAEMWSEHNINERMKFYLSSLNDAPTTRRG